MDSNGSQEPSKVITMPHLPNELIWEIISYLDFNVPADRSTLLNFKQTCRALRAYLSRIAFQDIQYSPGNCLQDVQRRAFRLRDNSFAKNIKGLVLKPSALLPKGEKEKFTNISSDAKINYEEKHDFLTRAFQRDMPRHGTMMHSLLVYLLHGEADIASQIETSDIRFHDDYNQEAYMIVDYFSRTLPKFSSDDEIRFPNLKKLQVSISISDGMFLPRSLCGDVYFTDDKPAKDVGDFHDPLQYLRCYGAQPRGRDGLPAHEDWVERNEETPLFTNSIETLKMSLFRPNSVKPHPQCSENPANDEFLARICVLSFSNLFWNLEALQINGGGCFFNFQYILRLEKLVSLSLSDMSIDVHKLVDDDMTLHHFENRHPSPPPRKKKKKKKVRGASSDIPRVVITTNLRIVSAWG